LSTELERYLNWLLIWVLAAVGLIALFAGRQFLKALNSGAGGK